MLRTGIAARDGGIASKMLAIQGVAAFEMSKAR
jgi:hypothetical protein